MVSVVCLGWKCVTAVSRGLVKRGARAARTYARTDVGWKLFPFASESPAIRRTNPADPRACMPVHRDGGVSLQRCCGPHELVGGRRHRFADTGVGRWLHRRGDDRWRRGRRGCGGATKARGCWTARFPNCLFCLRGRREQAEPVDRRQTEKEPGYGDLGSEEHVR